MCDSKKSLIAVGMDYGCKWIRSDPQTCPIQLVFIDWIELLNKISFNLIKSIIIRLGCGFEVLNPIKT